MFTRLTMTAGLLMATTVAGFASTLMPDAVLGSSLTVQLQQVGSVAAPSPSNDINSPVAIGSDLYVVDNTGAILRDTGVAFEEVLSTAGLPAGVTAAGSVPILNMAGTEDHVFVTMRSTTLPTGVSAAELPDDPAYRSGVFDIVYRYDRTADGALENPTALTAFEGVTAGHLGGGMLVLPDGRVALARGDQLLFNLDGLAAPQDDNSTVGRIMLIDPVTGATEVGAQGVRNVQRMTYADAAQTRIAFADMGAVTAEEINVLSVDDLADTSMVENFGWGRNADGNAREGTFYINEGAAAVPGTQAEAIGTAPIPEAGFIQPYAQFGREDLSGFFAVTGPVWSDSSFSSIDLLFGDLVNGGLFATLASSNDVLNDVFRVNLIDELGAELALLDLVDTDRVDLRFFNFADGGAGLLLEQSGDLYRINQVSLSQVPLPAGGVLLLSGLALIARFRRRAT